ncbi:GNAT family N-acetyltransferase [Catenulispora pinisilvae]|uniref:GNAT family N-acetyltransferase n=1 Tax=Catenulispora pinisilvae TaxID=2705253 RepID=UPI001890D9B9|nr:GNAT family N-acetyltransferase [Catenulispora pinisilvae]
MITTERLRLRPATMADVDFWIELHADPEVNQYVGAYTREKAETRLRGIEDSWAARGYGLCVVESLATGEAIGRSGLNWWEQFGETEAGWTFAREHWGHGYATEAGRAVLDWGFNKLELDRITALISPGNHPSIAVAERLGMTPRREEELFGKPCVVYALDRAEVDADADAAAAAKSKF